MEIIIEMKKLTVIKIGGKVIDDQAALNSFLEDFSELEGPKILVHGGGKIASEFGERLGIQPNLVEGRRITDAETLELVTMVYGGLVNKKIVAQLQSFGTNALGLTGADGNSLSANKRPMKNMDYGFVGDVSLENVNTKLLSQFLNNGITPVFCALTHDQKGNLLNTNADTISSVLASALANELEVELVYCFEQKGVFSDFENQTVISIIDLNSYKQLVKNGTINEGMIPKMHNAFEALKNGVKSVSIGHYAAIEALVNGSDVGTTIKLK